jgi:hypothetical protein
MHRRLRFLPALLTLAPHLLAAQVSACADTTITGNRVGVIRIGMSVASVRERCRVLRDTTEMNDGELGRVVYALVVRDTLRIDVLHDSVWFIKVRGPGLATTDSIHVGVALARFLVGRHPTVLVGEGKVYLLDRQHCGNSFGLSREAYARAPGLTAAALARLPRSTMIDEILVTGTANRPPNERCA